MIRLLKILLSIAAITVGVPALIWFCGLIVFTGSVSSMIKADSKLKTDAIIVLTGGSNRVNRGFDLLSQNRARHLLISGVYKDARLNELVELWGKKAPLPECCITLGKEAENTIGNSLEARKWVAESEVKSIRLITSNYHMPRALLEFRHTLPGIEIIPDPVIPKGFNPRKEEFWKLNFLEYHKLLMSGFRVMFFPFDTSPVPKALK